MADNTYDFNQIEAKWQRRWEEDRVCDVSSDAERPKFYGLDFFPYPSGAGISVGHCKNYVPVDAYCRYKSMRGYNVLHPMGWDAFGQPAENEAIKKQRHPKPMVAEYAANYRRQMKLIGLGYDWSREINSSDPEYYRWTQWFFLLLYHRGLAYRANAAINWCPSCATGLANEEVKEGKCWRCGTPVTRKPMPQWFFRITAYAERLLEGLDRINWSEGIKQMQREWIGRSEGAEVDFPLADNDDDPIRVYTTRPDTLYGATFMVLAPEHPRVSELTTPGQQSAVETYLEATQRETEIERMSAERVKTGVFTGSYAINPMNSARIPIWIADYVLMGYGTGAIMAVPAHDQRDFEFARKYEIPVVMVYQIPGGPQSAEEMTCALPEGGVMINSGPFNGCDNSKVTIQKFIHYLEEKNIGAGKVQYRLRDWLISRQRYWGAPIPIIHCPVCGEVAVPEKDLPVLLPEVESYESTGTGESPLAGIPDFVQTRCPKCGGPAHRETDTMGGFACSSWYFLRFADPHNSEQAFSKQMVRKWLPVDLYVGGAEHAVMHLLYARMWAKVMYDAGLIEFDEPFLTLKNQGMLLAYTPGRRPQADEVMEGDGEEAIIDWIVLRPEEVATFLKEQIVRYFGD
ncbi:MAG: leucine--tRNA ligase, partial [Armatimonadetes bacterium]|nr:leucine--tRNA ligase [Armatimonadota bacterium]